MKYDFLGPVYSNGQLYKFVHLYRFYDRGQFENGYMYFDDKLENVIIETNLRRVYACDDKFIFNLEKSR